MRNKLIRMGTWKKWWDIRDMDESHGSITGYSQPVQLRYVFLWIFQPLQLPGPFVHLRSVLDLRPVASILRLVQRWVRCIKVPLPWRCREGRWKGRGHDSPGNPPRKRWPETLGKLRIIKPSLVEGEFRFCGVMCFVLRWWSQSQKMGCFFLGWWWLFVLCCFCGWLKQWKYSKALGSLAEVKI